MMKHRLHTLGTVAALVCAAWAAPATAQGSFSSWQFAGGWPVGQMNARADWSSDLGADWVLSAAYDGNGGVAWSGPGQNWSSRPYAYGDAGVTVGWALDARGGAVGDTASGGEIRVSPVTALTGGAVASQRFHLWSALGANEPGYGISTGAMHHGYAGVYAGDQLYAPLYWRLDWHSEVTGNAITSANLYFAGTFQQAIGGTSGHATGLFPAGSYPWWSEGTALFPDMILSTSAGDNAGDPRAGRIDAWVTLSLSRDPILAAPVPEPSTWALMAAGLLGLTRLTHRTRGTPHQPAA